MIDESNRNDFTIWHGVLRHTHYVPKLIAFAVAAGIIGTLISFLIRPKFTAAAQLLPPQQSQGAAAALLGSLGGLAGAAAGAAGTLAGQTPSDQWIGLLRSRTIADALILQFDLKKSYEADLQFEARDELANRTKIESGKDSLIDISVEDENPQKAKAIVDAYIEQLRILSKNLAISEAAQRRVFYEQQLHQSRDKLEQAERELAATGVNQATLKANPELAAGALVQLRAQISALDVKLTILQKTMTDQSPEVQTTRAELNALRLQSLEVSRRDPGQLVKGDESYISKFRNFKYQEALYELLARQYELARSDEVRDSAVIQVVDEAIVPEKKSSPKRSKYAVGSFVLALLLGATYISLRESIRPALADQRDRMSQRLFRRIFMLPIEPVHIAPTEK